MVMRQAAEDENAIAQLKQQHGRRHDFKEEKVAVLQKAGDWKQGAWNLTLVALD